MDAVLSAVLERAKAAAQRRRQQDGSTQPRMPGNADGLSAKELEQAGICRRFYGASFAEIERRGLPGSENIRRNYGKVRTFADALGENLAQGMGLILSGSCGTMKTTMAVAVLRQHLDAGNHGIFVPMCSLVDNLFTMRALDREEWARYEKRIRSTQLLVLDDLGGEDTGQGWIRSKVDSILTERYNGMRSTIVTTNLLPEELESTYSGRIIDRLRSTSIFLTFSGRSERRMGMA